MITARTMYEYSRPARRPAIAASEGHLQYIASRALPLQYFRTAHYMYRAIMYRAITDVLLPSVLLCCCHHAATMLP